MGAVPAPSDDMGAVPAPSDDIGAPDATVGGRWASTAHTDGKISGFFSNLVHENGAYVYRSHVPLLSHNGAVLYRFGDVIRRKALATELAQAFDTLLTDEIIQEQLNNVK
jgi:hypothetical protein